MKILTAEIKAEEKFKKKRGKDSLDQKAFDNPVYNGGDGRGSPLKEMDSKESTLQPNATAFAVEGHPDGAKTNVDTELERMLGIARSAADGYSGSTGTEEGCLLTETSPVIGDSLTPESTTLQAAIVENSTAIDDLGSQVKETLLAEANASGEEAAAWSAEKYVTEADES